MTTPRAEGLREALHNALLSLRTGNDEHGVTINRGNAIRAIDAALAASDTTPGLDVVAETEGVVAHRVNEATGHVYGARIEGIEDSGAGWFFRVAYGLPEGTRVRVTAARLASPDPTGTPTTEGSDRT